MFFQWLKRKGNSPNISELEAFISSFTIEGIAKDTTAYKDKTRGHIERLSKLILFLAHRFASGLKGMLEKIDKSGETKNIKFLYDIVAIEAAAYSVYLMLEKELDYKEYDDYEDEDNELSGIGHCITLAASIANGLIKEKVSIPVPKDFILNRCMHYSNKKMHKKEHHTEIFSGVVLSSALNGNLTKRNNSISNNLVLQMCVPTEVNIFFSTWGEFINNLVITLETDFNGE